MANQNFATGGYLTLISDATQTALIDGAGAGTISGNITMQRYLATGFGYKYFSSPFQSATVNEFADDIDLAASFPSFYKYDESRVSSGWVSYTVSDSILHPMHGYTANFGSGVSATTIDITGVVNDGALSRIMYNNNRTYTKGFNLVGNPYPSPIDWDAASGWTKTNIDNAVYFFKAGGADEYSGAYGTYINGVSSDETASNVIPSLQGFFVHVSDGSYPVTGTLGMDNNVRIVDYTSIFLKQNKNTSIPLLRISAGFTNNANSDPLVIYFDDLAQTTFERDKDALKLMNTDTNIPNLYAVSDDSRKLSINSIPLGEEQQINIPIGLKIEKDGNIQFKIKDILNIESGYEVYLHDNLLGSTTKLEIDDTYDIYLETGEYINRFTLILSNISTGIIDLESNNKLLNAYVNYNKLIVDIKKLPARNGLLIISNIYGQVLIQQEIEEFDHLEFSLPVNTGIYLVSVISKNIRETKKVVYLSKRFN